MHIFWVDDQRKIIQLDMSPIETWDEYHAVIDQVHQQILTVTHPVIYINNSADVTMPAGNKLAHIEKSIKLLSPHLLGGMSVINNIFARRIVRVGFSIYGRQLTGLKVFATVDAAHTYAYSLLTKHITNT